MKTHDELRLLVAGYLSQDWRADYPTAHDAVVAFKNGEPPQVVALARQQAGLLAESLDEDQLESVLIDELGSGYWPPGEGLTFHDWLREVSSLLAD